MKYELSMRRVLVYTATITIEAGSEAAAEAQGLALAADERIAWDDPAVLETLVTGVTEEP